MSLHKEIRFKLNNSDIKVTIPVHISTLYMLRDILKFKGTKLGCGEGECGACTILVDGLSVNSCLMFAMDCDGREILTIEGFEEENLKILQEEFVKHGAVQCGFCTPGMLMQSLYLTQTCPDMNEQEIKRGIEGNLCRCTGYQKVIDAIASAVHRLSESRSGS